MHALLCALCRLKEHLQKAQLCKVVITDVDGRGRLELWGCLMAVGGLITADEG